MAAVALIAAAVSDPLVESISNTGVFGGGFHDDDHLGVLPVLIGGASLVAASFGVACAEIVRSSTNGSRTDRDELAPPASDRSMAVLLPLVFSLQLAGVYALESGERIAAGGPPAPGLTWLGAPVPVALALHAAVAIAVAYAVRAAMRAGLARFESIVRVAIDAAWLAFPRATRAIIGFGAPLGGACRAQAPHVHQIGGRAPPPAAFGTLS